MAIDFASLVLGPAMDTFAKVIVIDPIFSRPGDPPFQARGIFSSVPYQVQTMEGGYLQDQQTTLGIVLSDFIGSVAPRPRDEVYIGGVRYFIASIVEDGQGGATLTLRFVTPMPDPLRDTSENYTG